MSQYAARWETDVSYGAFDLTRLTGAFLSRIVLTHRVKYRKIDVIKNGTGYEAACSKYECWEEAFAVFSKESEFESNVVESIGSQALSTEASDDAANLEVSSNDDRECASTPSTTPILTPAGRKRLAIAAASNKKNQLVDSTLQAHKHFAELSTSFLRVNAIVEENEKLKTMKLRRDLGLDIIPQEQQRDDSN